MRHAATPFILGSLLFGTSIFSGCATTQPTQEDPRLVALEARLHEAERQNGRLSVRIEELEDQMFLVNDRVEANRLALQRRGMMRGTFDQDVANAPSRTPETSYRDGRYEAPPQKETRNTVRIPLSGYDPYQDPNSPIYGEGPSSQEQVLANTRVTQEEEEVIINDDTLRAFAGSDHVESRPSTTGSARQAQPPVTSERLPTSSGTTATNLEKPVTQAQKSATKDALTLYKESLSHYRSGQYQAAYEGFEAFLARSPSQDYVDNALYWLGECQFGLENFEGAVGYFQRLLRETPDGNKVPDAMLKMSLAYERQGRVDSAKETLEKLVNQYPTTQAGQLGAQKLGQ